MSIKKRLARLEAGIGRPERRTVVEHMSYGDFQSPDAGSDTASQEGCRIWCTELGREITREELDRLKVTHDVRHIRIEYVNEPIAYGG